VRRYSQIPNSEPAETIQKIAAVDLQPSVKVKPPRIAASPVSLKCELVVKIDVGPKSSIILGRVVFIHIQDEAITEASAPRIDTHKMRLISRMGGGGLIRAHTRHVQFAALHLGRLEQAAGHEGVKPGNGVAVSAMLGMHFSLRHQGA
jgi:hypothetical protein